MTDKRFIFNLPPGLEARIEQFRRKTGQKFTSEAMRQLIEMGLAQHEASQGKPMFFPSRRNTAGDMTDD